MYHSSALQPHSEHLIPSTLWGANVAPHIGNGNAAAGLPRKRVTFGQNEVIIITPRQTQNLLSCESIPSPTEEEPEESQRTTILVGAPPQLCPPQRIAQSEVEDVDDTCDSSANDVDATPRCESAKPSSGLSPSTLAATALFLRPANIFGACGLHSAAWAPQQHDSSSISSPTNERSNSLRDDGGQSPLMYSMSSSSTFDPTACAPPSLTGSSMFGGFISNAAPCDDNNSDSVPLEQPHQQPSSSSPLVASIATAVDPSPSGQSPSNERCGDDLLMTQRHSDISANSLVPLRQLSHGYINDSVLPTQTIEGCALSHSSPPSLVTPAEMSPDERDLRTPPQRRTSPTGLSTTRGLPLGPQCVFCSVADSAVILHSGYYLHVACALWCPEVYCDPMTELLKHIADGVARGSTIRCAHCHHPGATTGCLEPSCDRSYHYPCALEAQCALHPFGDASCAQKYAHLFAPDEMFVMRCPIHSVPSPSKDRRARKRERICE